MKISVVMACYNGAAYIIPQLESIRTQSQQPDEVIIADDYSMDNTLDIVDAFILKYNLQERWRTVRNDHTMGWKKNFYNATSQSSGDVIFFSDQDDVWEVDKIEVMTRAMSDYGAGCIYGGYTFIDEAGNGIPGAGKRRNVVDIASDRRELFNSIVTMGCRMCISRNIANLYLKIGADDYSYDTQCGRLAFLYGSLIIIQRNVIQYRIHRNNTSDVRSEGELGSSSLEKRIKEIDENIYWLDKLIDYEGEKTLGKYLNLFIQVKHFQELRRNYLTIGKKNDLTGLFFYRRYYPGISMFLGDFAYKHGINKFAGCVGELFS